MSKATVNGYEMHYLTQGEGRDVLLIHGLSGDLASWHPVVVGSLSSEYRVTIPDLRGHGRSSMPSSGYTSRELASDVVGLMDHLGIESAHLVGHSFGGAVALHTAVAYPRRVDGLVVADARIRSIQVKEGVQQWAHWDRVRAWLKGHGVELPERMADPDIGLLRCLAEHRIAGRLEGLKADPFFIPFARGSVRRAEQWLKLMNDTTAAADYKEPAGLTPAVIRHVASPTLAVYGALSHCLPTQGELAEMIPECTAHTIKGVGHFHPIAAPKEFSGVTSRFLKRISMRLERKPAAPSAIRPSAPESGRRRAADL